MQYVKPDSRQLRQFGFVIATGLVILFYALFPLLFGLNLYLWPVVVSAVFVICALLMPTALLPVYIPWMKLAHVLGRVNTVIILSLIYYLLITPMGIIFRLTGTIKDSAVDRGDSYKNLSDTKDRSHMEKPY